MQSHYKQQKPSSTWTSTRVTHQARNKVSLRYHPLSNTLLALIGTGAFAFNKYPHKPYIFWMLNSSILLLIPSEKSKYYEKLYVKAGVTVNISPGQPKINERSQLRLHLLVNTFDYKTTSHIFVNNWICLIISSWSWDSKSLTLPVKKYSNSKMKKDIKNCRHVFWEKPSDSKLAKFQPNWFTGCRLGV